jgi:hypothetical protein
MNLSLRKVIASIVALIVAITTVVYIAQNPSQLGNETLIVRAAVLALAIIAALIAVYPFNPFFATKPGAYAVAVCMPAILPVLIYYFLILPNQAGIGLVGEQLPSELLTDGSESGTVTAEPGEVVYTPTLRIGNHELYTRQVNVFLRVIDEGSNASGLFRAVRQRIPGSSAGVEATAQRTFAENNSYAFNPLQIPPVRSMTTKVVFVIDAFDDDETFSAALRRAHQVQFELRDPETGDLLLEFPLTGI